jgi:SAM-dependent methyltransferase
VCVQLIGTDVGDVDDVFDLPCLWREEAVRALGLHGEAEMAAISPGAAFPAALRSIAHQIPRPVGTVVDLGAGGGGASEWLRRELGTDVIAVEPAPSARQVAGRRFPRLDVRAGDADRSGLPQASADVVVMCGVMSLLDDLDPVLDEVVRVLRPNGWFAIADLFPGDAADLVRRPNTFRSFESLSRALVGRDFDVVHAGCGPADPSADWACVADDVTRWINVHCADRPGFREWSNDRDHLQRLVQAGAVMGGCLVARRGRIARCA